MPLVVLTRIFCRMNYIQSWTTPIGTFLSGVNKSPWFSTKLVLWRDLSKLGIFLCLLLLVRGSVRGLSLSNTSQLSGLGNILRHENQMNVFWTIWFLLLWIWIHNYNLVISSLLCMALVAQLVSFMPVMDVIEVFEIHSCMAGVDKKLWSLQCKDSLGINEGGW